MTLPNTTAIAILQHATANIRTRHPAHWNHVVHSDADLLPQQGLHPVFAGSYDWHSCVHQMWLLVRLLRCQAELPGAEGATRVLVN